MKIVYVSRWFPYPANNGSRLRVYNTLRFLAARHEVHLISFADREPQPDAVLHLESMCASVVIAPWREYEPMRASALIGLFSQQPRSLVDTHSAEMDSKVRTLCALVKPDVVIASQINALPYIAPIQDATRILDELEVGYLYGQVARAHSAPARLRADFTWWKARRYYRQTLNAIDGFTTVSQIEHDLVRDLVQSHTPSIVVPNGVEMPDENANFPSPEADTLIYCGSPTFAANLDAIRFFVNEILPRVAQARPNVRLHVTGELPTDLLVLPRYADKVIYTGNLAAVRPLLAASWVSIVPLLQGGGTRLKILESLAVGTPVVTTAKGMEGLALTAGRDLLCADRPEEFAAATVRVLESAQLRAELATAGKAAVAGQYQWNGILRSFEGFIDERNSARTL